MAERSPRLEIQHLRKDFGGVHALNGVCLEVPRGGTLGLIGPNGSGKTTVVNCVSGVFAPTAGNIMLEGIEITRWSRARRARAGVARTYQSVRLFQDLTAGENVEMGLVATRGHEWGRRRRKRLQEALADQELSSVERVPVRDLPYGIQRRVEIARALISEPRFLLLDEPAAGLGEDETVAMREFLVRAQQRLEIGILIIDHDVSLIMEVSDQIVVLREGHRIASGSPEEVIRDPIVVTTYLGTSSAAGSSA